VNAAEFRRLRALLAENEELRPVPRGDGACGVLLVRDGVAVREVGAGLRMHPRVAGRDPLWALRAELLGAPVVVPLRPAAVPPELLKADPESELVLRDMTAEFDVIVKGKKALAIAENRVAHTQQGLWTAGEAAAWIAEKSGDDASDLRREFERAFTDGKLTFGRPGSGFAMRPNDPPPHPELTHPGYRMGEWPDAEGMAYLTAEVVNDWLQREHPVSRIRLPTQQPHDEREGAPAVAQQLAPGDGAARHAPIPQGVARHTRGDRDTLRPVIHETMMRLGLAASPRQVMADMQARVRGGTAPFPLVGVDAEAVKWSEDPMNDPETLDLKSLGKRMDRIKKQLNKAGPA
jgi:hypothetical protein